MFTEFRESFRGTDKTTNFPVVILGIVASSLGTFALVIRDDGDFGLIDVTDVNVDFRWDPNKRDWVPIDQPED